MDKEIKLTLQNFESVVKNYDGRILIDFYANWCGPCKMMSPIIESIANESDIRVCKVNVDEENELANAFQISSIPAFFCLENGTIIGKLIGYHEKEDILAVFRK